MWVPRVVWGPLAPVLLGSGVLIVRFQSAHAATGRSDPALSPGGSGGGGESPAGHVSGGGVVRAAPPPVPPAGPLPRARPLLPALAAVLSPLLQRPRIRVSTSPPHVLPDQSIMFHHISYLAFGSWQRAASSWLADHMGAAAAGGVAAVRVVAEGTDAW
jgi:hypothetical protein